MHNIYKLQTLLCQTNGQQRTLQASARAKPPPSRMITLQGIFLLTVSQSRRGGGGPDEE